MKAFDQLFFKHSSWFIEASIILHKIILFQNLWRIEIAHGVFNITAKRL